MFDLTAKNALVTGATGGIGGAIARALHARGATVAISGRQVDKLETLKAEIKERVVVTPCDLANKEQVGKLIDEAGLKGLTIGGAQVSPIHANFIVNTGNARASDVKQVLGRVKEAVRKKNGIELETEVKILE